jgi:phospholipase C
VAKRKKRAQTHFDRTNAKRSATRRRRTKKALVGGRSSKAASRRRIRFIAVPADAAADNLSKIDKIVILLMENRSFDHMLGYLKLEEDRSDVDGLTSGMSNSDGQKDYPIHHLNHTALKSNQDPCHSGQCVADQLANNNGGFVKNYVRTHPGDPERDLVMGYYNKNELLTYDYLAAEFTICDHWFSSVPGATWPNRLYAVTGRANGSKDNKFIPIYNLPAFVRHLDALKVSWGWYSDNFFGSTLNLIDRRYRSLSNYNLNDFYQQAADGTLPSVCWIDPIFLNTAGAIAANDDHPPGDIHHGQEFVLNIYHALVSNSEQWRKTLFVVVYDEHGGFYDHLPPAPAEDDSPSFRSYGARVPAILISPWVAQRKVVLTLFDHTSIIKSILLRFCRTADGSIPDMGKRVASADHLGHALTEPMPRPAPPKESYDGLVAAFAGWHSERFAARFQPDRVRTSQVHELNEFQRGLIRAARRLPPKRRKMPPRASRSDQAQSP